MEFSEGVGGLCQSPGAPRYPAPKPYLVLFRAAQFDSMVSTTKNSNSLMARGYTNPVKWETSSLFVHTVYYIYPTLPKYRTYT